MSSRNRRFGIGAALALFLLTTPGLAAPVQAWDPCDPPTVTLPAIPPCGAEETRDQDAVVLCIVAWAAQIADARAKACGDGTTARLLYYRDISSENALHASNMTDLETAYFACVRDCDPSDQDCLNSCEAIYLVAKAAEKSRHTLRANEINQVYTDTMSLVEGTFNLEVAVANTAFEECIEESAPCK